MLSKPLCSLLEKEAEGRPWKSLEKRAIKKTACSWEAGGYIINRRGRPLTQWKKETSGGTEFFYVAIAGCCIKIPLSIHE